MANYTAPSGTVYTSPEVARQYGENVPATATSGVSIQQQTNAANQSQAALQGGYGGYTPPAGTQVNPQGQFTPGGVPTPEPTSPPTSPNTDTPPANLNSPAGIAYIKSHPETPTTTTTIPDGKGGFTVKPSLSPSNPNMPTMGTNPAGIPNADIAQALNQQGLAAAKASGTAPQTSAEGSAGVNKFTPPPPTADPAKQAQSLLEQSPEYQQWVKDKAAADQVQSSTEVDFIKQTLKDYNIEGINTELLNNQKIIDGTEDDIRNEVQAAGGFSTNSQVLALASARNKSLISRDNYLEQAKTNAMNMVSMMSTAFVNDRQAAQQALTQKLQLDQQAVDNREKIISATQEGYKNIIQAVGYSGFVNSLLNTDPSGKSLLTAEATLGFASGQLQNIAQQEKTQATLSALGNYTITSPYVVNGNGEVINTSNGYTYTSQQDFMQKTGMDTSTAGAKGLIKPLGLNSKQAQQNFDNQIKQAELNISQQQLGVSEFNAQTSRMNAQNSIDSEANKAGQAVLDDVGKQVEDLANHKTSWGAAYNFINTKYGSAEGGSLTTDEIDKLLHAELYRNPNWGG